MPNDKLQSSEPNISRPEAELLPPPEKSFERRCEFAKSTVVALKYLVDNGFHGEYKIEPKLQEAIKRQLSLIEDELNGELNAPDDMNPTDLP